MTIRLIQFVGLLLLVVALGTLLAHALELPNTIGLSREDYLIVQQVYRGWTLLGFAAFGALVSTLVLTVTVWNQSRSLWRIPGRHPGPMLSTR